MSDGGPEGGGDPGEFPAKELLTRSIEDKMRTSYLDYAMSVIVSRALPDVRDGLKPVHRRILYAMKQAGNDYNKPYKKSARIVGDVLGKFHPHSQDAVYDAIVRMAQDFSLRYPMVDGQGNFGSVDGDDPAAMRYTEIRMTRLAHEMMGDIDKETVDMMPNYDASEMEPTVLAPTFPSLLVNGSSGIAVGMATNIPPHNLGHVIDACLLLLESPDATVGDVIKKIKAPDFPTAGIIHGERGVKESYRTGRGSIVMRARADFEEIGKGGKKRQAIVVTELPYKVNKAGLVADIASLVHNKKLEGISDLRDESDRSGMRIVIELKRDSQSNVLLNNLFKMTEMQKSFPVNMVALVHGVPRTLDIKQMVSYFLEHRREVVYRRSLYDLERAREKAHGLEGLAVAVSNVEEVIAIIKGSPTPAEAKEKLLAKDWKCKTVEAMLAKLDDPSLARPLREPGNWGLVAAKKGSKSKVYRLSDRQAQTILDMRLARLTALEREKIVSEYEETVALIADLLDILDKPKRVTKIIAEELAEVKKVFGDKRRTEFDRMGEDIDNEELIERREMVVTLTQAGYIKSQQADEYRPQKRGGMGKSSTSLKEEDAIVDVYYANSHDTVLFFTSRGRVYWKKVYQLPSSSRLARGKPIVNILPLVEGEQVQTVLPVKQLDAPDRYVMFATRSGMVKKTALTSFSKPRPSGIIAINIQDGDRLIDAWLASKNSTVMLFSDAGKAVRFKASTMRATGRNSMGVKGMRLEEDQSVVSMLVADDEEKSVLTVTAKGKGKRTKIKDYPVKGRATKGVVNINRSVDTGKIVKCIEASNEDDVALVTDNGMLIRVNINSIRHTSRATAGVKLFNKGSNTIVSACCLQKSNKPIALQDAIEFGGDGAEDGGDGGKD